MGGNGEKVCQLDALCKSSVGHITVAGPFEAMDGRNEPTWMYSRRVREQ